MEFSSVGRDTPQPPPRTTRSRGRSGGLQGAPFLAGALQLGPAPRPRALKTSSGGETGPHTGQDAGVVGGDLGLPEGNLLQNCFLAGLVLNIHTSALGETCPQYTTQAAQGCKGAERTPMSPTRGKHATSVWDLPRWCERHRVTLLAIVSTGGGHLTFCAAPSFFVPWINPYSTMAASNNQSVGNSNGSSKGFSRSYYVVGTFRMLSLA